MAAEQVSLRIRRRLQPYLRPTGLLSHIARAPHARSRNTFALHEIVARLDFSTRSQDLTRAHISAAACADREGVPEAVRRERRVSCLYLAVLFTGCTSVALIFYSLRCPARLRMHAPTRASGASSAEIFEP